MPSLADRWTQLSAARRVLLVGAVLLAGGLGVLASVISGGPATALLFAGPDERGMGAVTGRLDALGAPYEMRENAIHVPADRRDGLRLALAAGGLRAQGATGYAVLPGPAPSRTDTERELARTLLSLPDIGEARVGIRPGPRATVGLTSASGADVGTVTAGTARRLVALAVPGLPPGAIPVFDGARRIPLPMDSAKPSAPLVVGDDRAGILKASIERLLRGLVGKDRLRVSVAVETVGEASARERRSLDRDSRVLRRTERTEVAETSARGEDGEGANAGLDETSTTERYDYTETTETRARAAGSVRRITVAVLIDHDRETAADGTVSRNPRPAAELAKIEALVKSAIGYDAERRDSVTVEQMSFADAADPDEGASVGAVSSGVPALDTMRLVQVGTVAAVVLILGLFVVRPVLLSGARPLPAPRQEAEEDAPFGEMGFATAGMDDLPDFGGDGTMTAPGGLQNGGNGDDTDPRDRLRDAIADRADESADVLRGWLDTPPDRRRAG